MTEEEIMTSTGKMKQLRKADERIRKLLLKPKDQASLILYERIADANWLFDLLPSRRCS